MATTEKIMEAVRAYGVLSMRLGVDYLAETLLEQHEQFNRIRAMLAPVAPDPGLQEAIAKAAYMAWWDYEKSGDAWGKVADAVLSVLAERGVR